MPSERDAVDDAPARLARRSRAREGLPFPATDRIDLYLTIFREVFRNSRSIRRAGSAALDLAYCAAGIFDGFFEFGLSPWDTAAGALLIAEAGGMSATSTAAARGGRAATSSRGRPARMPAFWPWSGSSA